ncbi:MAG: xanthine dehydrogenase family protein subunit M, partial [Chloroflexaceae bacterium]|nr:xanthine dehydrogenase family protein subunit M [Chloroflexaceae bacterium]
ASPGVLVDINGLTDLAYLHASNGHLAIGAMTREMALEESAVVQNTFHMLADAAHVIADPLVRNRATVGGNIAHADPANDHPAVMLAYNAEVQVQGRGGSRTIAIDDFFTDMFSTSMRPDELLTEIRIPRPAAGSGGAYIKMERKVGDYAVSAVAVQLTISGNRCTAARIALTNVSPVPLRSPGAERAIIGQELTADVLEAAGRAAAAECDPSADLRGTVEYKRDLTRVLVKRAIRKAAARAGA